MSGGGFRTCQWCGGIFAYAGNAFCPKCLNKLDEQFVKIRKYLYEHPNAKVDEVAEVTEVEHKVITHFLKEGRLELKNPDGALVCEKCGMPITSGRLCEHCIGSITNKMESVLPKVPAPAPRKKDMPTKSGARLHVDIDKR